MLKHSIAALLVLMAAACSLPWNPAVPAFGQKSSSLPKQQDNVALGEDNIKRLLPLMDTDKNGKISREEFMKYMDAEFKRLDKNNDGQLDVKELTKSNLRISQPSNSQIK